MFKNNANHTVLLTYHMAVGKLRAADVQAGKVKATQATELTYSTTGGVMVNKAKVTAKELLLKMGVIHVMDSVVMPRYKLALSLFF